MSQKKKKLKVFVRNVIKESMKKEQVSILRRQQLCSVINQNYELEILMSDKYEKFNTLEVFFYKGRIIQKRYSMAH